MMMTKVIDPGYLERLKVCLTDDPRILVQVLEVGQEGLRRDVAQWP